MEFRISISAIAPENHTGDGYSCSLPVSGLASFGMLHPRPFDGAVTSSCLCKYAEGAVFPFQIESLEDGVDDAVHGLHVDEANHGPGSSTHFDEAAFDDIGGAQLAPQVLGKTVEGQQVGQIAFQLPHHGGIFPAPAAAEDACGSFGLPSSLGKIDGLCIQLDGIMVALADLVQDVAHLVHPAA